MGNTAFRDVVKPQLEAGQFEFIRIMSDGGDRLHDGTNNSNEIALLRLRAGERVLQKVMLSSPKYHQRRKALTEMVHAIIDELLGGQRVVPDTYAESWRGNDHYSNAWGWDTPKEGRKRVCQVVHEYKEAVAGDVWRGEVYRRLGNLAAADDFCKSAIEAHPDAERIALLDFLTINQDRSARNWITDKANRFYAIDNGMAWFHEYPDSDDWKIGTVIDDVLLQVGEWRFISGVFTTSYAGETLSSNLRDRMIAFDWSRFDHEIDNACLALGLPELSADWRFLGFRRRFRWIMSMGKFPPVDVYREWLKGSYLMTPPEIMETGGKLVWQGDSDH